MTAVRECRNVLIPVPGHRRSGVVVAHTEALVGRRAEVRGDHRIYQHLARNCGPVAVAGHQGGHRGQVAAGAVTGNQQVARIGAERGGLLRRPVRDGIDILGCCRPW